MVHPNKDAPQEENLPSGLAGEVSGGIGDFPRRVERYEVAKLGALDVAEYIGSLPEFQRVADQVRSCGDYLVFRHYFTVDAVKLHGAQLCKKHLLCPFCAVRRGARSLKAYLDRWSVIQTERPNLQAFLLTLTVKDGDDLRERFAHLHASQRELWKRVQRGRGSSLDGVAGAVWSYEIKRGSGSRSWHPHLHAIVLAESSPSQRQISDEWRCITGDSFIVDVRPIVGDPFDGFSEVFKYAMKFSGQLPEDTFFAWQCLRGKRLLASSGCFRGVPEIEGLLDDTAALDGLPFDTIFLRWTGKKYRR